MKFGIFDHLDRKDLPLARFYEERLKFVSAADRLGLASYHIAEHHCSPAGMAPRPSVFLSAVAQRTKRIRLGPMAYALANYDPLILAEEICMLDHLSNGRVDIGVGRGVSPWELMIFGINAPESKDIFRESMEVILKAFTQDVVDHRTDRFRYYDAPMEIKPLQAPYPPLWYPTSHPGSRDYAAAHGMHLVAGWAPNPRIKQILDLYREAWERHGNAPLRAITPYKEPYLGSVRHVVVAETDDDAIRIARESRDGWVRRLEELPETFGFSGVFLTNDFDAARKGGSVIAGTPDTVREEMARHIDETGVNYVLCQFAFGNIAHEAEMRSLKLFATEVMPHLATPEIVPLPAPARRARARARV